MRDGFEDSLVASLTLQASSGMVRNGVTCTNATAGCASNRLTFANKNRSTHCEHVRRKTYKAE